MTFNADIPAPAALPRIGDPAPDFDADSSYGRVRDSVSCPANWQPGDDVVLGAPTTEAALDARLADHDLKLTDWYLATVPDRGAER